MQRIETIGKEINQRLSVQIDKKYILQDLIWKQKALRSEKTSNGPYSKEFLVKRIMSRRANIYGVLALRALLLLRQSASRPCREDLEN